MKVIPVKIFLEKQSIVRPRIDAVRIMQRSFAFLISGGQRCGNQT
jgi:hypothetical protein